MERNNIRASFKGHFYSLICIHFIHIHDCIKGENYYILQEEIPLFWGLNFWLAKKGTVSNKALNFKQKDQDSPPPPPRSNTALFMKYLVTSCKKQTADHLWISPGIVLLTMLVLKDLCQREVISPFSSFKCWSRLPLCFYKCRHLLLLCVIQLRLPV